MLAKPSILTQIMTAQSSPVNHTCRGYGTSPSKTCWATRLPSQGLTCLRLRLRQRLQQQHPLHYVYIQHTYELCVRCVRCVCPASSLVQNSPPISNIVRTRPTRDPADWTSVRSF
jgi:hypothetical protein